MEAVAVKDLVAVSRLPDEWSAQQFNCRTARSCEDRSDRGSSLYRCIRVLFDRLPAI